MGELTKLLKEAGFRVITAHNVPSALHWLHTEAPDAILLDEKFTTLDGLSSAAIIKGILPNAVVILANANDPNLAEVVQSLSDMLGSRQVDGAGASSS